MFGRDKLCPPPTEDELKVELLAHFDRTNPRFAQIIRLKLENKTNDEICVEMLREDYEKIKKGE